MRERSMLMPVRRIGGNGQVVLGYNAAAEIRRSPGSVASGGSGDYHLRTDRGTLLKQSRSYDRDSALFQGMHRSAITNILGAGFQLQAMTGNQRLDQRLEQLWREEFCEAPEVRGLDTWPEIERFALSDVMVAGDVGAILLEDGQIQMIEAERIDHGGTKPRAGARMESGIELDGQGRPLRFYVKEYDSKSSTTRGRARAIDREDFVYSAYRRRMSQTRGVPALTASFSDLNRLDDILSSEAASWQILSRLAVTRKQEDAPRLAGEGSIAQDNYDPDTEDLAQRVHDVGMALIFNCKPGESIEGVTHNIPGPNFEQSVRVFLRLLGLPLGLPLELIILDWSQTTYSSARAALEQAFVEFTRWQRLLMHTWHSPIYRWRVRGWIAEGRAPDHAGVLRHAWITPSFPWLDQLKEAQAWGMKLDRGLSTHAEALKSVNRDRDDWLERRERELLEAAEIAGRIVEAHPELDKAQLTAHFAGLSTKTANTAKKGEQTPTSDRPEGPDAKNDDEDGKE
jgi:lambda family phage portal protein